MPSTQSQENLLTPYGPELRRTLRRMVGRSVNLEVHNDPTREGQGDVREL